MRRAGIAIAVFLLSCSPKTPTEAASAYDVQVSDGFRNRGGVALTEKHVITDLEIVKSAETARIYTGQGKSHGAAVLSRDSATAVGVLFVEDDTLDAAPIGDSGKLSVGAPLATQIFDDKSKPTIIAGQFTGWRYHQGRAYLETDIAVNDATRGAGVFDSRGTLVGVLAFALTSKLNYALPIEYLTTGQGVAASLVTGHTPSQEFNVQHEAAKKHPASLTRPLDFNTVQSEYRYSRSAIVGRMFILDKKDGGAHNHPMAFKLVATNAEKKSRTIAEGLIEPPNMKWSSSEQERRKKAEELRNAFGDVYLDANFNPYDYGEIRYRIELSQFCKDVTAEEVHNFTVTLADGRNTGAFGYSDLVNVCAAREDGDGGEWEKAWGMMGEQKSATAEASPRAAKQPKKKPKKKPKKRRR